MADSREGEIKRPEKALKAKKTTTPDSTEHHNRKDKVVTDTGLEISRLYTAADCPQGEAALAEIGSPGQFPFTRGSAANMYTDEPWIMRSYSGFGEASACNNRYRQLVRQGTDEIVMAVDLPTQVGYDSDHLMARGEVGKVGVAIDTLRDMEILFDGIPLNSLKRVSMLGNSFSPTALSLFIALGEKQGLTPDDFVVDLQNDILKEYVARGTYIYPIRPSIRITTDTIEYCALNAKHWYPCTICTNHINAAGAGSSYAMAFALCNGLVYMRHLMEKGHAIDDIAPLFSMFMDERSDFFVTIALLRAARKIWARVLKEMLGARSSESLALKITAYSHGGETLLEPVNNIVRITLASLAYVLGGVHSLYNASYDEVLGTPTEEASKIALRTQQILAYELGITNTADPLGGSYFIENLTRRIEEDIYTELTKVENMGGAIEAIESGYYQRKITEGALKRQKAVENKERIIVGVNKFRTESQAPSGAFRIDPALEDAQLKRLQKVKQERNNEVVKETLSYVREIAEGEKNLVPAVLEAVRAYATIGEISDVLRGVFGEYQAKEFFSANR